MMSLNDDGALDGAALDNITLITAYKVNAGDSTNNICLFKKKYFVSNKWQTKKIEFYYNISLLA